MAEIKYSPTIKCDCGSQLKVFASSGRTQIMCAACRHAPRPRATSKRKSGCMDYGKPAAGKRCRPCYDAATGREGIKRDCVCRNCGKSYRNKRKSNTEGIVYCSRKCYFDYRRANPAPSYIRYTVVRFVSCKQCRKSFVQRGLRQRAYCSQECLRLASPKASYYKPVPLRDMVCAHCKRAYKGRGARIYCSPRCGRAAFHKRNGRDRGKHRKRARRAGVLYQPVNVMKVFERDGWRCQVCGKQTPKDRRGTNYSNAPELDHRIPLAKGGPHTYSNVQCACRACNGIKGASLVVGQLPLLNHAGGGHKNLTVAVL